MLFVICYRCWTHNPPEPRETICSLRGSSPVIPWEQTALVPVTGRITAAADLNGARSSAVLIPDEAGLAFNSSAAYSMVRIRGLGTAVITPSYAGHQGLVPGLQPTFSVGDLKLLRLFCWLLGLLFLQGSDPQQFKRLLQGFMTTPDSIQRRGKDLPAPRAGRTPSCQPYRSGRFSNVLPRSARVDDLRTSSEAPQKQASGIANASPEYLSF